MCCDERGLAIFSTLRRRRNEPEAFLYAFDLLELDGLDMRREPIETRKATLASILRKSRPGVRLNEHLEHPDGLTVFQGAALFSHAAGQDVARCQCPRSTNITRTREIAFGGPPGLGPKSSESSS